MDELGDEIPMDALKKLMDVSTIMSKIPICYFTLGAAAAPLSKYSVISSDAGVY